MTPAADTRGTVAFLVAEYAPGGVKIAPPPCDARPEDGGRPFCCDVDMASCDECRALASAGFRCNGTKPHRREIR